MIFVKVPIRALSLLLWISLQCSMDWNFVSANADFTLEIDKSHLDQSQADDITLGCFTWLEMFW